MGRTPDRRPGETDEEGILLENRPSGDDPSSVGGIRLIDGSFSFRDSLGLFNPRSSTSTIGGVNTEVQYNGLGFLTASSYFRYDNSKRALTVTNISGSLTALSDGSPYLISGGNIKITTSSLGSVIVSTVNSGTIHGINPGTGLLGGGTSGEVTLEIDDSVVATVSGATFDGVVKFSQGLSGSLTSLVNGDPYIVAGAGIMITTGSNGSITIINDGTVGDITAVNPGEGLIGGGSSGAVSLSVDDSVVATISGSTFTGAVKFNGGLSGSLTSLVNGDPYLVSGGNIRTLTGSNGSVTISTINSGTIHGVNPGVGLLGGGSSGNVTLSIDDSVVATVSGATFDGSVRFKSGLSGSLTKLDDGTDYLVAGSNVILTTGSSGNVTISLSLEGGSFDDFVTGSGTGTKNYIPKWVDTGGISNSIIYESNAGIGIGATDFSSRLFATGSTNSNDSTFVARSGLSSPVSPVIDVQSNLGGTLFYVSGSGELGLGGNVSSLQTTVLTTSSTTETTLMTVSSTRFRSAEFIIQGTDSSGNKYSQTKILAVHNGSSSKHTVYGSVEVGGITGTFDVSNPSGGAFLLRVTPASTNSTVWKVTGILTRV